MRLYLLFIMLFACVNVFADDTTIRGGKMELRDKGEQVVFTEGVRLERGTDILKATEMITNKGRDQVTAKGNVELYRKVGTDEEWKGWGNSGFYDTKTGDGYLLAGKEPAHLVQKRTISSTETQKVDIYADRFDFKKDNSQAFAKGTVFGNTTDPKTLDIFEFWSQAAQYDGTLKQIHLTGTVQPKIRQTTFTGGQRTIIGDSIVYDVDGEHLVSTGNAQAYFKDEKDKKKKP